jgi:hypothetical protein
MTTTSDPTPVTSAPAVVRKIPPESWFSRIFGFLGWLLSGFGLFSHLRRLGSRNSEEIVVYSVHPSFFLWALVLIGFLGGEMVHHMPHEAVFWGWLYVWVLLYTLVTLVYDISTPKFLLWLGIFSFLWLVCKYLEDVKKLPVLGNVLWYFSQLRPALDSGFVLVISWLLLPAWVGSLFQTFSRGRKTFTPNSIEEWYIGEGCEVTDRSGLKFRSRYRDIFETVLGLGAGDLEAIDGTGHVVKRWPNVLFLAFTWKNLDEILHQRAATVDNPRSEPVAVEDVKPGK